MAGLSQSNLARGPWARERPGGGRDGRVTELPCPNRASQTSKRACNLFLWSKTSTLQCHGNRSHLHFDLGRINTAVMPATISADAPHRAFVLLLARLPANA